MVKVATHLDNVEKSGKFKSGQGKVRKNVFLPVVSYNINNNIQIYKAPYAKLQRR